MTSSTVRSGDYADAQTVVNSYDKDGRKIGSTSIETIDRKNSDGSHTVSETATTRYYDEYGEVEGESKTTQRSTEGKKNDDGSVTDEYYTSTTEYDADGNQTGKTETTTTVTTAADGTVTETETTTTYDANGTVIATSTRKCVNGECQQGFVDPEHVGVGTITAGDWDRVAARLNSIRKPGPDSGDIDLSNAQPPTDEYDPMVALINPDGAVVIAAGTNPTFNRAQPEYDPRLGDLVDYSGVTPPVQDGSGPVSWP